MDFTDSMIKEVLFALQQKESMLQSAPGGSSELKQPHPDNVPRPAGRHFKNDVEPISVLAQVLPQVLSSADPVVSEQRLAEMQALTQDDELHVLTKDYIVAVTNQVVHKLERAS